MVCGCRLEKCSIHMNCSFSIRLKSTPNFLNMWLRDLSNLINVRFRDLLSFLEVGIRNFFKFYKVGCNSIPGCFINFH
eukprot:UN30186